MRLIDADELLKKAEYIPTELKYKGMRVIFHGVTAGTIANAPTIDPESLRPHGEWVVLTIDNDFDCAIFGCSHCKSAMGIVKPKWRFCPNCGAKMGRADHAKDS